MKGCDDYGATIQLYLDAELSGQDREDFRAHLAKCETCHAELEAGKSLSALLHRSRPLYLAPDALRGRLMKAAESFTPTKTYAPLRLRKRIVTELARPLLTSSRRVHHWGALLATILLVAVSILLLPDILRQWRADGYIETAVAAHRSFLDGSLPLEIQSGSPAEVTAWFTGKVPFTFRLPDSAGESGHGQVYRLTGGRLVQYGGKYAALIGYQMQQQKISLLVASSSSAAAAGGEELLSGGIVFHYSKQSGFNVITWSKHGLTYALVSSLPGSGRQSCLVCHQNLDDGSHFSEHR